mmetsp:Transcript_27296/g.70832  ORF Transcript_27296/g.70832 Transcript_27296/m.70832 type:complete len:360 (-) Transcript_27296:26-1105(-)
MAELGGLRPADGGDPGETVPDEGAMVALEGTEVDDQRRDLPFWRKTKNKALPDGFWDQRRQLRNKNRSQRNKINRRNRNEALRQEEEEEHKDLSEEEVARLKEEAYQQRIAAYLAQKQRVEKALAGGIRLVVECSFIQQYSNREVRSMAKQLEYSVVANKRAAKPMALTFCSWEGDLAEFAGTMGGERWPVNREMKPVTEAFPAEQLVVLSPDGEAPLLELDPDKVYCIGGIVDRTTKKNVTKSWADERGAPSMRLPIDEFCPLPGGHGKRHVLNINDVVVALLEFHSSGDWKQALDAAMPERKKRGHGTSKHMRRKKPAGGGSGSSEPQERCPTGAARGIEGKAPGGQTDGTEPATET